MENQNIGQPLKKSNRKKIILWSLGLGLLTTASIFSYQQLKKKTKLKENTYGSKQRSASKPKSSRSTQEKQTADASGAASVKSNTSTTQAQGIVKSIGNFLKNLKRKKNNQGAVTNSNNETTAQTKTTQEQTTSLPPFNPKVVANDLHTAASGKDFQQVVDLLKSIKNTHDFSTVNKLFSSKLLAGVYQTIITGLLRTFKSVTEKQTLNAAFTAIGLKYNGTRWTLSGISKGPLMITTRHTQVWKDPKHPLDVPEKMILGKQVTQRGDFTVFESEHKYFLVKTKHIKRYESDNQ